MCIYKQVVKSKKLWPESTHWLGSLRLRLHETRGEFHPGVKFWFRLHGWFHPGMKGKQFHPGMKSMSKASRCFWFLPFCFYKMAILAVNWYAQFGHSPLVIRKEAQKNVISAGDRKESSVYMDFWSRDEISSRCWRTGWNRPGMSKFQPGIM